MANELAHGTVGTTMTQSEFEAVGLHVCNSQATGDLIYASSGSQLSRLAIGSTNNVLHVAGGIPAWTSEITSVTLTTAVAKGTWTASGTWTLPAFKLGGHVDATGYNISSPNAITGIGALTLGAGCFAYSVADNSWMGFGGGNNSPYGGVFYLYGKTHSTLPGVISFQTPNTAVAALVERLKISGNANTAVATWAAVTHTGIHLTSANNAFGSIVLPTGAGKTVDNVITELQNLGLVTQA